MRPVRHPVKLVRKKPVPKMAVEKFYTDMPSSKIFDESKSFSYSAMHTITKARYHKTSDMRYASNRKLDQLAMIGVDKLLKRIFKRGRQ